MAESKGKFLTLSEEGSKLYQSISQERGLPLCYERVSQSSLSLWSRSQAWRIKCCLQARTAKNSTGYLHVWRKSARPRRKGPASNGRPRNPSHIADSRGEKCPTGSSNKPAKHPKYNEEPQPCTENSEIDWGRNLGDWMI